MRSIIERKEYLYNRFPDLRIIAKNYTEDANHYFFFECETDGETYNNIRDYLYNMGKDAGKFDVRMEDGEEVMRFMWYIKTEEGYMLDELVVAYLNKEKNKIEVVI